MTNTGVEQDDGLFDLMWVIAAFLLLGFGYKFIFAENSVLIHLQKMYPSAQGITSHVLLFVFFFFFCQLIAICGPEKELTHSYNWWGMNRINLKRIKRLFF